MMDVEFCVSAMQDALARYGVPEIVIHSGLLCFRNGVPRMMNAGTGMSVRHLLSLHVAKVAAPAAGGEAREFPVDIDLEVVVTWCY